MKKPARILVISLVTICVLLAIAITFTIGWRPFLGPRKRALTNRQFERTPERLARGRYLTQSLLGCGSCHSPKDWSQHEAPTLPGMELVGQPLPFPGFPGNISAPNLTPDLETGSRRWSDDQIARAIREGIKHDDTILFPMMPYSNYRTLSDEDLTSVVVYLRSLTLVRNPLPPTRINFPVNYLVRSAAEPVVEAVHGPSPSDPIARAANTWCASAAAATMLPTSWPMLVGTICLGPGVKSPAPTLRLTLPASATTAKQHLSPPSAPGTLGRGH